ncbi:MAG: hypothetical protein DI533_14110 [Cereibacter sphaeroides]|uniref:Endonuclease n=1 Tax=Cereibacter sphaeroides TaxID=1063 RepID=A0A2W5S166_CERSP|nr:MAG: hypothetical protein DI533_14110 [Cereibacter sphaeroides]
MLTQMNHEQLLGLSKYDRIAIYLFRDVTRDYSADNLPSEIPFDQDTVRRAMRKAVVDGVIDQEVANVPDIKYTYDARRNLPAEMEQAGPLTWMQNGKGKYVFRRTRRMNIIDLTTLGATAIIEEQPDQTPKFISALLGLDEQAVFTRVRNAGLISTFLGFQAWPIQGHHRTTVTYGQVEVDEVQAGIDSGRETIVPISGKGGQDKLSWSQALNLNTYGKQKAPIPGLAVRSLGLWRDELNTVWIVEFSPHTDIDNIEIVKIRRFTFR